MTSRWIAAPFVFTGHGPLRTRFADPVLRFGVLSAALDPTLGDPSGRLRVTPPGEALRAALAVAPAVAAAATVAPSV